MKLAKVRVTSHFCHSQHLLHSNFSTNALCMANRTGQSNSLCRFDHSKDDRNCSTIGRWIVAKRQTNKIQFPAFSFVRVGKEFASGWRTRIALRIPLWLCVQIGRMYEAFIYIGHLIRPTSLFPFQADCSFARAVGNRVHFKFIPQFITRSKLF